MPANPKQTTFRDKAWLISLREHPCIITGVRATEHMSVVAAHIGTAGKGIKSDDRETLPLLDGLHKISHQKGEVTLFREQAPDWLIRDAMRAYAREYYRLHNAERG
jgi:hypothetical protein